MKGEELANQANENLGKINLIHQETNSVRDAYEKENYRIRYDVFRPKIAKIERERDKIIEEAHANYEQKEAELKQKAEALAVIVTQVERILDYLRLDTGKGLTINDDEVQPYRSYKDTVKENLGYIFDDAYLKIKLFMVENDKPKNKYSLIALGHCLFHDGLLNLPHAYGVHVRTPFGCYPELVIRDFPSVPELTNWLKLHRDNILAKVTGEYEQVKTEYLDIIKTYKVDDFQELLVARCTCGYFYTKLDNRSSRDIVTCLRCNSPMTQLAEK